MISITVAGKAFFIIRLNELSNDDEFYAVKNIISNFKYPLNDEVEEFLKYNALDFSIMNAFQVLNCFV